MPQGPLDIRMVKNNDINFQFSVFDNNGNPLRITDYIIVWQVRKSYLSAPVITKTTLTSPPGVVMVNAEGGIFMVVLAASDTVNLPPGNYFHEAILTDTSGKSVTLTDLGLDVGTFYLREQYAVQS
jgi:hypothetical protein